MNKPRYLEYLLHLLHDSELTLLCGARFLDETGPREEQIQRILQEPVGKVSDEDYLRFLPDPTLRRLCKDVGYPRVAERSGPTLLKYAVFVFRGVDWSRFVELNEADTTATANNPKEAWRELVTLGQATTSEVRNNPIALSLFVEWTGESPATLLEQLNQAEPNDKVKDVLAEVWPHLDEAAAQYSYDDATGSHPALPIPSPSQPPPERQSFVEEAPGFENEEPSESEANEEQDEPELLEEPKAEMPSFSDIDEWEAQDDAHWFLDDMMQELYLWLRHKRTIVTAPRRGKKEILVKYTALHDEQYGLLVHFDGTQPVSTEILEHALRRYGHYQDKPIASLAVLAHAFDPDTLPLLRQRRRWQRNVGLFAVNPDGFQVIHQERKLRPMTLLQQFLEQRQQQMTQRAPIPDLSDFESKMFADSLHNAPTSRGFVPFQSVVVKQTTESQPPPTESNPTGRKLVRAEAFQDLKPGQILAERYVLLRHHEECEVGKTFIARDQQSNRDCQLKVIRPDLAESPEFQARFSQQFEQFRDASKHKQIGTYYDYTADAERGLAFFTMELVEGETLEQLLQANQSVPPLPLDQSLQLLQTVARALTHIHNRGFVHRDVKPDNIILLPEGDWKLMDFGVITHISSTQPRLYTSVWESSERPMPRANDLHTPSGDMYALGVLAYRLFTGVYPYPEDLKPPSALHMGYNEELDNLLMKALSPEPDQRPSSAALFIRHIRLALDGLVQDEPGSHISYTSQSPLDSNHRSSPPQRPGSSTGFKELIIRWYSQFFRYSLTKQAIEQRRARLRFLLILLGLGLLGGGLWWWLS